MQRWRRAVNVVQQLREARQEEPKPLLALLLLLLTLDVRFLACVMSWTIAKSKTGWTQTCTYNTWNAGIFLTRSTLEHIK
jgi:hypothetical protein